MEILLSVWSFISSNFPPSENFKNSPPSPLLFSPPPLILKNFSFPRISLSSKIQPTPSQKGKTAMILQTRTYWKLGTRWDWNFKFLKCKNEIYQRIELKEKMRKIGVIRLVMFTPRVMVIKMSKMTHFMYLLLNTAKISWSKIFNCIWKVLFSPFRKYCELCSSELPLAKFQHLKIQDFGISLLTQ